MDIGIGTYITLLKETTTISGLINGLKVDEKGLERLSLMEIDYWFWMNDGWQFINEMEEDDDDGEI
jgi:hypothetical protein